MCEILNVSIKRLSVPHFLGADTSYELGFNGQFWYYSSFVNVCVVLFNYWFLNIYGMNKDILRVERSTSKLVERCSKLLERNLLIPRSSDARLDYFIEKYNLIHFI